MCINSPVDQNPIKIMLEKKGKSVFTSFLSQGLQHPPGLNWKQDLSTGKNISTHGQMSFTHIDSFSVFISHILASVSGAFFCVKTGNRRVFPLPAMLSTALVGLGSKRWRLTAEVLPFLSVISNRGGTRLHRCSRSIFSRPPAKRKLRFARAKR